MNDLIERTDPGLIALVFGVGMLAAWCLGWRRGQRSPLEGGEDPATKFIDGSMALLGLLLAFTFSMSLSRHEQRRAMVVTDSNAIGDFYTCASLLKEPHRGQLQTVVHEYAQARLAITRSTFSRSDQETAIQRSQDAHTRMTEIVAAALAEGTPIAVPLTNTLNAVTSSHASRLSAFRDRVPWIIVVLLFLSSVLPAFLLGMQQGVSQKRHFSGMASFIVLVSVVIYVTLDLNQPGSGLITVSQEPMERLLQSMSK
jgi:hypothetical protein